MPQSQGDPAARVLETVEHRTGASPTASVIWLHGLGADGHDFASIVPDLNIPGLSLRFVFPHAPVRAVTINMGMRMRAWFDVRALDLVTDPDIRGIRAGEIQVRALIRRENQRGISAERIVLAGFSQGGALALYTGLRYEARLAGILALSAFLPLTRRLQAEASAINRDTPIFLGHGSLDPLVDPSLGERTRDALAGCGYAVEWRTYPIPHAVSAEEIADVRAWLETRFASGSETEPRG